MSLIWNVYRYNINKNEIELFNIFDHYHFCLEVKELLCLADAKNMSKEEFDKKLDNTLMYWFWCKSEYEIIIGPFIGNDSAKKKIDIYKQVKNNWTHFVDYMWANRIVKHNVNSTNSNQWIPCKEGQMPENFVKKGRKVIDVLVTTNSGRVTKAQRILNDFKKGKEFWHWGRIYGECAAWMWLPKKYEE